MAKEICAKLFLESIAFALAYTSRAYDLSPGAQPGFF